MIATPKVETRTEQPYVSIRTQAAIAELPTVIPQLMDEVFGWLGQQDIQPAGAPFIRYHVINMETKLDIEIGVPVPNPISGNGRTAAGTIPSGRYAALLYTGPYDGLMDANRVLIGWAEENGIQWDNWDTPQGDAFGGRFEFYLTDPAEEPDPAKWKTEVAIRLAD